MMGFLKTWLGFGTSEEPDPGAETSLRAFPQLPPAPPAPPAPVAAPPRAIARSPRPLLTDSRPDFPSVLDQAGVTSEERLQVQKAQDLLKKLPSAATDTLKREIVGAAFSAFDISTEDIVGAATAHIEALNAFVVAGQRTKLQAIDDGDARVRELQSQIAEVRAETERAVAAEDAREVAAREEIARVEPVLAFFLDEQRAAPVVVERPSRGRPRYDRNRTPDAAGSGTRPRDPAGRTPPIDAGSRLPEVAPRIVDPAGDDPMLVEDEVVFETETEPEEEEVEELELELDLDLDPDTGPDADADADELTADVEVVAISEHETARVAAELQRWIEADHDASPSLADADDADAPLADADVPRVAAATATEAGTADTEREPVAGTGAPPG